MGTEHCMKLEVSGRDIPRGVYRQNGLGPWTGPQFRGGSVFSPVHLELYYTLEDLALP